MYAVRRALENSLGRCSAAQGEGEETEETDSHVVSRIAEMRANSSSREIRETSNPSHGTDALLLSALDCGLVLMVSRSCLS
jgi:hypothetical protein